MNALAQSERLNNAHAKSKSVAKTPKLHHRISRRKIEGQSIPKEHYFNLGTDATKLMSIKNIILSEPTVVTVAANFRNDYRKFDIYNAGEDDSDSDSCESDSSYVDFSDSDDEDAKIIRTDCSKNHMMWGGSTSELDMNKMLQTF